MLDASLKRQLDVILDNHRTRTSGESLARGSRAGYQKAFEDFVSVLQTKDPKRSLRSVKDFNPDDLGTYQRHLEQKKIGGGALLKPGSITRSLMGLKAIFQAAYRAKLMPTNIVAEFKPKWHAAEEGRCLTGEEVERLCEIDETYLKHETLLNQFFHIRNAVMFSVQKDAALRAGEVFRLCDEDIQWARKTPGGVVPVLIRESKGRLAGSSETVPLTPWATARLKRYLDVRQRMFQARGLKPTTLVSDKSGKPLGTVLFVNQQGATMDMGGYQQAFRVLSTKAGLDSGYTTHDLRHTRICEWVDAGLNPRKVQHLARHKSVQLTLEKYYHTSEKEIFADLDGLYGTKTDVPAAIPKDLIPSGEVRRALFQHALKAEGHPHDEHVLDRLDRLIEEGEAGLAGLYYTVHETCAKLKIQRTQLYVGWIPAGHIHPLKDGSRTVFLKAEVDALAGLRTTEEASLILGYREKKPTTILRFASQGLLPAIRIGKTMRFKIDDLIEFLKDKNSGRLRLPARVPKMKMPPIGRTGDVFGSASFWLPKAP
ncbi:MAG: tyrosine-type recombinase/integrase [Elusimicrobia bacterium]|nr:tyrosine-type recombinase/integrase [Elusimicrobiota bacterium]